MVTNISIERWKYLKQCILKKKLINDEYLKQYSVRRFSSFELFEVSENDYKNEKNWYNYLCPEFPLLSLKIRIVEDTIDTKELIGFNNTGNICIWPSEEVLAFYCLSNINDFYGKNICELGGGMTCLAGLSIAHYCKADMVLLTDGNEKSVENLKCIVNENIEKLQASNILCELMRWGELLPHKQYFEYFDFVISADCLLFEDYHLSFLDLIEYILKPRGLLIIFAPKRGNSFENFISKSNYKFNILTNSIDYNEKVISIHDQNIKKRNKYYDENIHLPRLLILQRK